jgi:hypothetical protein
MKCRSGWDYIQAPFVNLSGKNEKKMRNASVRLAEI